MLNMPSPKSKQVIQKLAGRVATLSHFIPKSSDRCLLFFILVKCNKAFQWDEKCEAAFQYLKKLLTTPPLLAKLVTSESLLLYLAVSDTVVSATLVREEGKKQKPVYYVSQTLLNAETHYPLIEKLALALVTAACKLRPYFQYHSIIITTAFPLRVILHKLEVSR